MINLEKEIEKALKQYGEEVKGKLKEQAKKVSDDTVKDLKNTSPKKSGKYAKSWGSIQNEKSVGSVGYTVANKKHYRLTHLLEYGHLTRNGKRTKSLPHIEEAEQKAISDFEKGVINAIEQ